MGGGVGLGMPIGVGCVSELSRELLLRLLRCRQSFARAHALSYAKWFYVRARRAIVIIVFIVCVCVRVCALAPATMVIFQTQASQRRQAEGFAA